MSLVCYSFLFLLYIFIGPPHKFLQVKGNLITLPFFAMLFSLLLCWPVSPYQSYDLSRFIWELIYQNMRYIYSSLKYYLNDANFFNFILNLTFVITYLFIFPFSSSYSSTIFFYLNCYRVIIQNVHIFIFRNKNKNRTNFLHPCTLHL